MEKDAVRLPEAAVLDANRVKRVLGVVKVRFSRNVLGQADGAAFELVPEYVAG